MPRVLIPLLTCLSIGARAADDPFRRCLVSGPGGSLGYCLGVGAIEKLRSLDADPEFDIADGVTFARDGEQQLRDGHGFVDRDPGDFRGILETMGEVLSRRRMRWDMDFLYPGLQMHLSPSASSHREALNQHSLKEAGTGRLLARQFMVPFLLGFKFNVATLVPIIFGLLALIAKKALFLSKAALVITSALGLGSLLFGGGYNHRFPHQPPVTHSGIHHHGILQHHGGLLHYSNRYPEEELYREAASEANKVAYPKDDLHLYEGPKVQEVLGRNDAKKGRNFAWSVDEKNGSS